MRDFERDHNYFFKAALDAENQEFDYCKRCQSNQPHENVPCPTWDNPLELAWICLTCEENARKEAEAHYEKEKALSKL